MSVADRVNSSTETKILNVTFGRKESVEKGQSTFDKELEFLTLHKTGAKITSLVTLEKYLGKEGLEGADENGDTLLHRTVRGNFLEGVEYLLRKNVQVSTKNKNGDTPLHIASIGKDKNIILVLLSHGADVNLQNNVGETALYNAVDKFHIYPTNVEVLLGNKRANPNIENNQGLSPLELFVDLENVNRPDIFEKMLQCGGRPTRRLLELALFKKRWGIARLICKYNRNNVDTEKVIKEILSWEMLEFFRCLYQK